MVHAYGVDSESEILKTTRQLVDAVVEPNGAAVDSEARYPRESIEALGEA